MFSTVDKTTTLRTAVAQAVMRLTPALIEALKNRATPKGDPLEVARVAGIQAAKKTAELIPFCHPIPLDQIAIEYDLGVLGVTIKASVTAIAKTGVEMEALVAAQVAAATLYDMLKPLDADLAIQEVKVVEKRGGKSDFADRVPPGFKAAVLVTSDGTAAGTRKDSSGKIIQEALARFEIPCAAYQVLPDDLSAIRNALLKFYEEGFRLVITTGGTGLGPRDVTVEATRAVIDREVPGVMEAARVFGQQRTPYAMLSRGIAGVKGKMLIVNLPGSSRGARESLAALLPGLLHGYPMMGGEGH